MSHAPQRTAVFDFGQSAELATIRDRLLGLFGLQGDEIRLDPVSQFIRSFLGSQTYDQVSWDAFAALAHHYGNWNRLADASPQDLAARISTVTYFEDKARDLLPALHRIRAHSGTLDLAFLRDWSVDEALRWLEMSHGVGRKIAAATLNFSSLRKRAFVADTHVIRVLARFGFAKPNADGLAVYNAVMAAAGAFDADALYELHWLLKYLGQNICTHARAHCQACPLEAACMKRITSSRPIRSGYDGETQTAQPI
jgi:endonuclease III